jgi:hypothetical protein
MLISTCLKQHSRHDNKIQKRVIQMGEVFVGCEKRCAKDVSSSSYPQVVFTLIPRRTWKMCAGGIGSLALGIRIYRAIRFDKREIGAHYLQ